MALLTPVFAEELLDADDPPTVEAIVCVAPDMLSCDTRDKCGNYTDGNDTDSALTWREFYMHMRPDVRITGASNSCCQSI